MRSVSGQFLITLFITIGTSLIDLHTGLKGGGGRGTRDTPPGNQENNIANPAVPYNETRPGIRG